MIRFQNRNFIPIILASCKHLLNLISNDPSFHQLFLCAEGKVQVALWNSTITISLVNLNYFMCLAVYIMLNLDNILKYGWYVLKGKLTLKIPWKNLYTEPTIAILDGLYVIAVPNSSMFILIFMPIKDFNMYFSFVRVLRRWIAKDKNLALFVFPQFFL